MQDIGVRNEDRTGWDQYMGDWVEGRLDDEQARIAADRVFQEAKAKCAAIGRELGDMRDFDATYHPERGETFVNTLATIVRDSGKAIGQTD